MTDRKAFPGGKDENFEEITQESIPLGECSVLPVDSDLYQDMLWCADCGGLRRFIPLERWPGGWRGLCWGCEREKYVLTSRGESEAA